MTVDIFYLGLTECLFGREIWQVLFHAGTTKLSVRQELLLATLYHFVTKWIRTHSVRNSYLRREIRVRIVLKILQQATIESVKNFGRATSASGPASLGDTSRATVVKSSGLDVGQAELKSGRRLIAHLFDTLKNRVVTSSVIWLLVESCSIQIIEEPIDTAPEKVNAADVTSFPG
jgi:hypothetical protein